MLLELSGKAAIGVARLWRSLLSDRGGATAIEYGLIIGLIAIALLTSIGSLGDLVNTMYNLVAGRTNEVASSVPQS